MSLVPFDFKVDDSRHERASIHFVMRRLLCWVLILAGTCVAQKPAPIAAQLDAREQQLEKLYADYWRMEYKIALGESNLSSRPIQEQIRTVVSDDKFLVQLKKAKFTDPLLQKRQKLFLNEAVYTKITNDPALTAVVEQVTNQDNAIRYKVGDRSLTRAELTDLLEHNPDRRIREAAWRAETQITKANGDHIRQAIRLRNDLASKYSDEIFSMFMLHRKGLEVQDLFSWFDQIKEQTEPEYQRLLAQMRKVLGVAKIEPWDLDFYFANFTQSFEAQKFPVAEGWPKAKQLAQALGYNLDSVEMHDADLGFGGAAYPVLYGKEAKILANRYKGIDYYDHLFHATGHALHYELMDEPSYLIRANYAEPMDEGTAQVFTLQLYRPEVEIKTFALSPAQARQMGTSYRLRQLMEVRGTIADALSEFETYGDPDQDPSAVYNRIHSQYLGVDMHDEPVWAFNSLYGSDPIYLQSLVVGDMVAHQIVHHIDQQYGRTWGKAAGEELKADFFARGAEMTIDEYMKKGTGEALTPRYLVRFLSGSLTLQ
ncbi:Oligoendopeptidase F-like protein [Candidatus Koribacter versatilis Ellin345]|uniref:Oligoendopeptidase F-like protein n=2 Tax=Candidatus Korobacter versatilis TaxID=658062 RepID=Q1ISG7_KORVE|nr:Oligoendopeptidase F-like protein [Candidatus Koribacter versatilis Ellin345]